MSKTPFYSELDSTRFGIPVAKVNFFESSAEPATLVSALRADGIALVISKVDLRNVMLINQLENLGFRIKDAQVTYIFALDDPDRPAMMKGVESAVSVRTFERTDLDAVVHISEESFVNYGHYFANDRLDRSACLAVYTDWAHRSCTEAGIADRIFVAEKDGELAGFLSFKMLEKDGKRYAAGGLGAVSERFRGKNVFKKIASAGLEWGLENHLAWEEHNVVVNNTSVNRAFADIGFKMRNHFVSMHCWLD